MREGKQLDQQNTNAAVTQKVKLLEAAGYDKEFVKAALPQILGIGQYKKPADPQEVRRMLFQSRLNDFKFARMKPAEQAALIEQDLQLINGGSSAPANPMSAGMPGGQAAAAPAATKGVVRLDTKTGQILPYQ
jgi:hypothetical protein